MHRWVAKGSNERAPDLLIDVEFPLAFNHCDLETHAIFSQEVVYRFAIVEEVSLSLSGSNNILILYVHIFIDCNG